MEILVESAVRVTLLAAAVAVLLHGLRIGSPRIAHRAWAGVVAVMLVLPALVAWGPEAAIPILPERGPALTAYSSPADAVAKPGPIPSTPVTAPKQPQPALNWDLIAMVVYGSGVILLFARLGLGIRHSRMLVRGATLVDGRLTHPRCITPVTVGLIAPVVILPADWVDWSEGELAAVLAHEEEHARRRDPLVAFVTLVNRAVFWFHPLAWWVQREISRLSEQACDAVVVAHGHDADVYSASLLRFAKSTAKAGGRVLPLGTTMPGAGLRERLGVLADPPAPRASAARLTYTAMAYGAAVVLCSAATLTTASAQSASRQVAAAEWSMHASEHFEIFYERQQEHRVGEVTRAAEEAYTHISGALKYDVPQRVPLILVSRDRDLASTVELANDLVAASGAPARNRVVISTESLDTQPGVIRHELTHHFAFEIIPQTSRVAPWLIEGLAEYHRGVWDSEDLRKTRDAVAQGQMPALGNLFDADRHWGHALFDFVAAEYGAEGIRRYLFALRARTQVTDAVPVAFSVSVGQFERTFHAYLGARFGER